LGGSVGLAEKDHTGGGTTGKKVTAGENSYQKEFFKSTGK
jgi:hypothetical protein